MLETIGYEPAMAGWASAADTRLGRVVRVDRGIAGVLTEAGMVRAGYGAAVLADMAAEPTAAPSTGDWCVLREWPDDRVTLDRLLPRRSAVIRAVAGERSHGQVLCANVDLVAVVVALHPDPVLARVERLLALAGASGARPVVVLTKADLVADAALVAEDVATAAPGTDVLCTSAVTGEGVDHVRRILERRLTMALVGSSGHGKSSLVNALVGADTLVTRDIRADGRGRHTSVRRELVPVPGGGAVIDTPGLRGIGLPDAGGGLDVSFADVEALAGTCRFRDCSHQGEPGCAVAAAVASGALPQRRFESWLKLRREAGRAAARALSRQRAERRRRLRRRRGAGRRGR